MPGQRILESLRFWWGNLAALLLVTAPFAIAGELLQWWLGPAVEQTGEEQLAINAAGALAILALRPFLEGAVIAQLSGIQQGKALGLGECLAFSLRAAPWLVPVYLLVLSLSYAGLLVFLLPGIWIYARLCLAPFITSLEGRPPIEALQASVERTRGNSQWIIFAAVALLGVIMLFGLLVLGTVIQQGLGDNATSGLILAIITTLAGTLISILAFRFHVLATPAAPPGE